jgi:non-ribosomal peptide synthetase component F
MYLIAKWHHLEYELDSTDRVTQQTAPAFDPVGLELWSTWMAGASLHIIPDAVRSSPPILQKFMIEKQITIAFMPTPIASNLIEEPWPEETVKTMKLRAITTGGDRLLLSAHSPALPPCLRFDNWYGPRCVVIHYTCVSFAFLYIIIFFFEFHHFTQPA